MNRVLKKIRKILVPHVRRRAAWRALPDPEVLVPTKHGHFFVNTSDEVIGKNLFVHRQFDHAQFRRLLSLLPRRYKAFVDVGANIGTHTVYALNSGRFREAVCFEPEPGNFRLLKKNIAANRYDDQCKMHPIALGAADGSMMLEISGDNHGDHRLQTQGTPGQYDEHLRATTEVQVKRLDDMGLNPEECFLHVDVQGAEMFVFDGASRFLEKCDFIYSEFWPYGLERHQSLSRYMETIKAHFTHFCDLSRRPERQHIQNLDRLVDEYGFDSVGTDLLLIKSS